MNQPSRPTRAAIRTGCEASSHVAPAPPVIPKIRLNATQRGQYLLMTCVSGGYSPPTNSPIPSIVPNPINASSAHTSKGRRNTKAISTTATTPHSQSHHLLNGVGPGRSDGWATSAGFSITHHRSLDDGTRYIPGALWLPVEDCDTSAANCDRPYT